MDVMLITGAGGLVGSAVAEHFHEQGCQIVGVDNDLRGKLLHDPHGSTQWNIDRLSRSLQRFRNHGIDVRDKGALTKVVRDLGKNVWAIVHCAAQTAHEGEIGEDFSINVLGTLNMLELWRSHCPNAVFVYMSTIKVYGNYPNTLDYQATERRYDLALSQRYYRGFDESVSIDQGISSFFGRSKTSADLYVQEYIYQFGLRGACFRASCLTGGRHAGTESHGMLSYMMRCAHTKTPYRIYGYEGRQVRDQLHAEDMVQAIDQVIQNSTDHVVYNIGGGRNLACSILEAIELCEEITGQKITYSHHPMRTGDHRWWVTDNARLEQDCPKWKIKWSLRDILDDIYARGKSRW